MHKKLKLLALGLVAATGLGVSQMSALAQDDYPTRPITIIVPLAPGGGVDIAARMIAQSLTESLGQQVIVENRPGAAGTIGVRAGRDAAPDGYTLMVVGASYSVNPALYELDFDPVDGITPIVMLSQGGQLLVAHPSLGVETVEELVELARNEPDRVNAATTGTGSISDLAAGLLASMADVQITRVPYGGTGPALTDTVAGVTDIHFSTPGSAFPQIEAGMLVGLATTTQFPMPGHPEIPTIADSGLSDYEVSLWYGVIGPPDLPDAIVERINTAVNEMLEDPAVIERISGDGHVPMGGSPEELREQIAREVERWVTVVDEMNIEAQ